MSLEAAVSGLFTKLSGFDFVFFKEFDYNTEQPEAHLCGIGDMWGTPCRKVSPGSERTETLKNSPFVIAMRRKTGEAIPEPFDKP